MTRFGRRSITRCATIAALAWACALVAAPSAGANHVPPRYYTFQIPAQDDTPENTRLYATLGGVGNGNRIGDPVILATRAGLNARQEWLAIHPKYPNLPEEVVRGSTGWRCWLIICVPGFEGRPDNRAGARVKLVSRYSGKCLSIEGVVGEGAEIVQRGCRENDPKQVWYFVVDVRRGYSQVSPVYWYREGELRCLGHGPRRAGRQLTVHRRRTSSDPCPHWVVRHAVSGSWRRPFSNPF